MIASNDQIDWHVSGPDAGNDLTQQGVGFRKRFVQCR